MANRQSTIERDTFETQIKLSLNLDGTGQKEIESPVPFFNHMMEQIAKHGLIDFSLKAKGDIEIDAHHTVEDVGIAFGQALSEALGDKKGICRYGHAYAPLDESLVRTVIDISGRPGLFYEVDYSRPRVGDFDLDLIREFFQGFVNHAKITVHIDLIKGINAHHQAEAVFKSFAQALKRAIALESRVLDQLPSTKGLL